MIYVDQVSLVRNERKLVDSAEFEVNRGEFISILGPNGAGKSTLLNLLSGDMLPTQGRILFDSDDLTSCCRLELAQKRAVMSQAVPVAFPFSVFDVVLLGRSPHIQRKETIQDHHITQQALRIADVHHLSHRDYGTLSGGERQRVQFARAIAQVWPNEDEPTSRYLLLDEPLSNLDLKRQLSMMQFLRELTELNFTIITVIHDLNLATQFADKILLMDNGQVVAFDQPELVLTSEILKQVYGIEAIIQTHPISSKPIFIPYYSIPQTKDGPYAYSGT